MHAFGVHTGQQDCTLDELRRVWRFVDSAGFDWLSVWDHFYEAPPVEGNGPCFETISTLTLMAAETHKCESVVSSFASAIVIQRCWPRHSQQ